MLWIALHLPLLSLESFAATLPHAAGGQPLALMDAHLILSANAAARALGVKPGLKRATALALAPQLTLGQADPARDAQALTAVAHVALAFTPSVVIQPAAASGAGKVGGADVKVLALLHGSLAEFPNLVPCRFTPDVVELVKVDKVCLETLQAVVERAAHVQL